MHQELAQTIALQAITFICADEQRMNTLFSQSGLGLNELKSSISQPDFQAGILDFLLSFEDILLDFAAQHNMKPEDIVRARQALPGGQHLWD
jgi:hypothetical protein